MKRVVLLWIAAFILIPQGIAQIPGESPYKRPDPQNDFIKQKRSDRTDPEGFKGELHEERINHMKTAVRSAAAEKFLPEEAMAPFNGETVDIPDTAFLYALIDEGVDTDMDSLISLDEAGSVLVLSVYNRGISDMTGIEAFVMLESLDCANNNINSLDMSNNPRLRILHCNNNQLSNLEVFTNDSLEVLICSVNYLSSLFLPDDCALSRLYCDGNFLWSLDVTGCPSLEFLRCSFNEITALVLLNNPLLQELECEVNRLTSLDLSNNLELNAVWCGENLLSTLDLSNNDKIGRYPFDYVHLNVEYMPSLGEVCVWEYFPGNASVGYDGSPNLCFESGWQCNGKCTEYASGIQEFKHSDLLIYPNPTPDLLTIETAAFGTYSIRIHTLNGQEIFATNYTGTLHQVDLSFCPKGIYILHIRSDKLNATKKLVKL